MQLDTEIRRRFFSGRYSWFQHDYSPCHWKHSRDRFEDNFRNPRAHRCLVLLFVCCPSSWRSSARRSYSTPTCPPRPHLFLTSRTLPLLEQCRLHNIRVITSNAIPAVVCLTTIKRFVSNHIWLFFGLYLNQQLLILLDSALYYPPFINMKLILPFDE